MLTLCDEDLNDLPLSLKFYVAQSKIKKEAITILKVYKPYYSILKYIKHSRIIP